MNSDSTLNKDYTEIELVNACGIGDNPAFIEVSIILSSRSYSKKSLRKAMCKTIESGNFKTFDLLLNWSMINDKSDIPIFDLIRSSSLTTPSAAYVAGFALLRWGWHDENPKKYKTWPHSVVLQQGYAEICYHKFQTIVRKHKIKGL